MYSISHLLLVFSTVFVTNSTMVDYKVYETKKRSEAHLFVYKTDRRFRADFSEDIWMFTDRRSQSNFTIRWVKYRWDADLIIYWTGNLHEVGWKKKHNLQGKLNLR